MTVALHGTGIVHSQTEVLVAKLEKSVRIAGQSRIELGADLKTQYEQGASIRELARATGRSYGFIHGVLTEAQVPLRGRGLPGTTRSAPQPG